MKKRKIEKNKYFKQGGMLGIEYPNSTITINNDDEREYITEKKFEELQIELKENRKQTKSK